MKGCCLSVFFLLLMACRPSVVFEQYKNVPDETWNRYQVMEFVTLIPDSGQYQVNVCLRHTTDYEMANLWCFVSLRSSGALQLRDTLNLKIAEADGRWLGHGGTIKTLEQPIRHNPLILPKGNVIFRIGQAMKLEDIKGVKDVGIVIEKVHVINN